MTTAIHLSLGFALFLMGMATPVVGHPRAPVIRKSRIPKARPSRKAVAPRALQAKLASPRATYLSLKGTRIKSSLIANLGGLGKGHLDLRNVPFDRGQDILVGIAGGPDVKNSGHVYVIADQLAYNPTGMGTDDRFVEKNAIGAAGIVIRIRVGKAGVDAVKSAIVKRQSNDALSCVHKVRGFLTKYAGIKTVQNSSASGQNILLSMLRDGFVSKSGAPLEQQLMNTKGVELDGLLALAARRERTFIHQQAKSLVHLANDAPKQAEQRIRRLFELEPLLLEVAKSPRHPERNNAIFKSQSVKALYQHSVFRKVVSGLVKMK